ncbi:MAG TPA: ComEC/Rec2 family competence protein, partial [Candidatus Glassbacteria bacterium]|nr:ComEC/Rec2 family competence protein [Candidatus Glassbacteria bacterium]
MPETDSNRPAKLAGRLPAFWFSLLLAAGITAGRVLGCSSRLTLSIFSILFLLYLLTSPFSSKDRFQFRTVILCFLLASGGMAAISLRDRLVRSTQEILPPFGSSVALAGRVISPSWTSRDFDFGESQHFEIEISALKLPELDTWRKADFRACVTLPAGDSAGLSGFERIALAGRIEPVSGRSNPGGFDWREYQAARGVAAEVEVESREDIFTLAAPSGWDYLTSPSLLAGRIRAAVVSLHGRLYPSGEIRGVADALLAGDRNRLSAGIRKTFTASGTVHVLVVSGLHTSVVALVLFYGFSLLFGRGLPTSLITIAGLALFSLTSGGRPSVVRASLMCTLALLALPLHRVRVLFNSISSAFALSLLVRPDWLFDIGFQLSFAAVAGIGLLTPLLESRFRSRSWWQGTVRRWLVRLALASTAAQLAITPLVATYFHRVTPVSILANLAVIPLAMASVVAGLTADVLALVWLPAAEAAAALNSGLIELMLLAARFFSGFGWSAIEIPAPGAAGVVFSWLVVYLAAAWWAGRKSGGYLALTCLLWLNFQLWGGVLAG